MPFFVPMDNLKMTTYCFLSCIVSNEELVVILHSTPLYVMFSLSLKAFRLISLFLDFSNLKIMCLDFFFFAVILRSLDLLFDIFHYLWQNSHLRFLLCLSHFSLRILLTCILEAVCCYFTPEITYIIYMCILYII